MPTLIRDEYPPPRALLLLELFYYVAKFGGISAAVRSMPYGIQQPSMSAQLACLEEGLGAKLFHRRPFGLTVEGVKLYEGIRGFFTQLPDLEASIREEGSQHLRIAACVLRPEESSARPVAANGERATKSSHHAQGSKPRRGLRNSCSRTRGCLGRRGPWRSANQSPHRRSGPRAAGSPGA